MVAIFTGSGFGLEKGSGAVLGGTGLLGGAAQGRGNENVLVNAATGNLLLQKQDEFLAGKGPDVAIARTYNSLTTLGDDNGDKWRQSTDRRVYGLTGTLNTAGSTVKRVSADGAELLYTWDTAKSAYVIKDGGGAYDAITYDSGTAEWVWTDGDTRTRERYYDWAAASGRAGFIKSVADISGNTVTFTYQTGTNRMSRATTQDGSYTEYTWDANGNVSQILTGYTDLQTSTAKTLTRTRYGYESYGSGTWRLKTVTVDLSPGDNSVADAVTYVTTYAYDASNRVNSITQSDGSSLTITYDGSGRVATLVQTASAGVTRTTTMTYGAGYTTVTDPAGQVTRLDYDAGGNLTKITAPPAYSGATAQAVQFGYNANGDLTSSTDARGEVTTYSNFTANGLAQTITDRESNTITRTYDSGNRLLSETRYGVDATGAAVAQISRYVYNAAGNLRFSISAEGRVTEYVRASDGSLSAEIEYAEAAYTTAGTPTEANMTTWTGGLTDKSWVQRTDYTYDARLGLLKQTSYGIASAAGAGLTTYGVVETNYVYDQAGQLLSTNATGQSPTTYIYDGMGRLTGSTEAGGNVITIVFNDANTKTTITNSGGRTTTHVYNKAGDLLELFDGGTNVNGGGRSDYYSVDKLGRTRVTTFFGSSDKIYDLYDLAGRHTATIDRAGNISEYRYDANNRLVGTIQYRNLVSAANLTTLDNPDNTLTIAAIRPASHFEDTSSWTVYDDEGRVRQVIAGDGSTTISEYDASGRLQKTTSYVKRVSAATVLGYIAAAPSAVTTPPGDPADTFIRYFYDKDGLLIGTMDGEKYIVQNTYDKSGQLTSSIAYANATTAASPASASFNTLVAGVMLSSAQDRVTRNVYDGSGRLRYTIDALGNAARYDYDAAGLRTRTVTYATPLGALADYTFDYVLGQLATQESANSKRVDYAVYDTAGRLAYSLDQQGGSGSTSMAVTAYIYDTVGNLIRTVAYATLRSTTAAPTKATMDSWAAAESATAGNRTTRMWYNGLSELKYTVDAEGYIRVRHYDIKRRLGNEEIFEAAVSVTDSTTYSQVAALATGTRYYIGYMYDSLDRVTAKQEFDGSTVSYTYHGTTDLVTSEVRAANRTAIEQSTTNTAYDGAGRVVQITEAAGVSDDAVTAYVYNGRGVTTFFINPRNISTAYTYDLNGRLKTAADSAGTTTYDYNAFGEVWKVTDPRGNATHNWYDKLGRVTSTRDAENYLTQTSYTAFGEVQNVKRWATALTGTPAIGTEPVGSGTVATTSFVYDKAGRVQTSTDAKTQTESYTYNAFGDRTYVTNRQGLITTYTFDRLGRMVRESYDAATVNHDATGAMITGSQIVKTYAYDSRGNLKVLTEGYSTVAGGAVSALRTTSYTLDSGSRVTQVTYDAVTTVADDMVTTSYGVIPTELFTYDKRGNVIKHVDKGGAATFSYYDDLDRKIAEVRQLTATTAVHSSFTYDENGNLTSTKVYEGVASVPSSPGGAPPAVPSGLYRQTDFAYDYLDRMTSSTVVSNAGNLITSSAFSGEGYLRQTFNATASGQIVSLSTDDNWIPVTSGSQLSVQAGVEASGPVAGLDFGVHFRDAAGNYMSGQYISSVSGPQGFNTLIGGFITVPAGAASMRVELYMNTSGAGVGTFSLVQPMVAPATVGQTVLPAFTAGPPNMLFNAAFGSTDGWYVGYNPQGIAAVLGTADAKGVWSSVTSSLATSYQYDANGNVVKLTDPKGAVTWNWYDKLGRKTAQLDGEKYLTTWTYDAEGNILQETRYATRYTGTPVLGTQPTVAGNGSDRITIYTYDLNGNRVTEKRTGVTAWTVNASDGSLSAAGTDSIISYSYNALNQVTSKTVAGAVIAGYVYHTSGRLDYEYTAAYTDANGSTVTPTTTYNYDAIGDLTQKIQWGATGTYSADNRVINYRYGEGGRLMTMTDAAGNFFNYSYDVAGRLKWETYTRVVNSNTAHSSNVTTTIHEGQGKTYDLGGRVLTQSIYSTVGSTFTRVGLTSFQYNNFDQVTQQGVGTSSSSDISTGSALYQTSNQYDAAGRLVGTNSGDGIWKFFGYDKAGNQTVALTSAGAALTSSTGFAGALAMVTSTAVNGTYTIYDKRGQATHVVEEGRELSAAVPVQELVTGRTYNAFGEVTTETNAKIGTVAYTYNTMGRRIRSESPGVQITNENGGTNWIKPSEDYYYDLGGRLIGSRDANGTYGTGTSGAPAAKTTNTGNLTSYVLLAGTGYDGGQALASWEFHADTGKRQTLYDRMGDARVLRDELYAYTGMTTANDSLHFTEQTFNVLGQLIQVKHDRMTDTTTTDDSTRLVDNYAYDQFGQRIQHFNSYYGASVIEKSGYDALGRITSQTDMENHATNTSYSWNGTLSTSGLGGFGGWRETVTYSDSSMTSETSNDIFGREISKTDLGGHTFTTSYDAAGRMASRTTGATSQTWAWYNTGLLKQAVGLNGTEDYGYDKVGNRTSEKLVQSGQTVKDATATYDALGRMTAFNQAAATYTNGGTSYSSPSMANSYSYDAMGNVRSTVSTHAMFDAQGAVSGSTVTDTYWYRYDSMNRLVVDKGVLSGVAGAGGTTIVRGTVAIGGPLFGQDIQYNVAGERVAVFRTDYSPAYFLTAPPYTYFPEYWQEVREGYDYNGDGTLKWIGMTKGNQVSSAAAVASNPASGTAITRSALSYDVMGRLVGQTDYDDVGVAVHSRTTLINAINQVVTSNEYTIRWNSTYSAKLTYSSTSSYTYANSGQYYLGAVYQITGTSSVTGSSTKNTSTTNTYAWFDGAVQSQIVYDNDTSSPGSFYTTTFTNDVFGQTPAASVNDGRARTVSYKLGGDGQILRRDEVDGTPGTGDPHEVWYRFNGREMAYIGNDGTDNSSTQESIYDQIEPIGTGAFRNGQQFRFTYSYADTSGGSYEALNSYSQGSVAGTYQVQSSGESLRSIALQIWGDASLWYKLAEANGIDANTPLMEGQRLTLPAGVVRTSFNADTLRPYDPADAMGNVSPTTPKPKKAKCGVFGQILLAAVAVAVTVLALPSGGASVGVGQGILAGLAGGAASQAVGLATGIQEKFDFKGLALSAIGGGVTAGVGQVLGTGAMAGRQVLGDVVRGVVSSSLTQGIGVAAGFQGKFSWAGVAAAGIMAGVGGAVLRELSDAQGHYSAGANKGSWIWNEGMSPTFGAQVAGGAASLIAGAATRSAITGSSFGESAVALLPDAVGQVVGRALGTAAEQALDRAAEASGRTISNPSATSSSTKGNIAEIIVTAEWRTSPQFPDFLPEITALLSQHRDQTADREVLSAAMNDPGLREAARQTLRGGTPLSAKGSDRGLLIGNEGFGSGALSGSGPDAVSVAGFLAVGIFDGADGSQISDILGQMDVGQVDFRAEFAAPTTNDMQLSAISAGLDNASADPRIAKLAALVQNEQQRRWNGGGAVRAAQADRAVVDVLNGGLSPLNTPVAAYRMFVNGEYTTENKVTLGLAVLGVGGVAKGVKPILGLAGESEAVILNNGWRTLDGKFARPRSSVRPGGSAETGIWDAIAAKPGWSVRTGNIGTRDASGQLRYYDGIAISPRGRIIGLEVKSGLASKTAAQRIFDETLNSSRSKVATGVGRNAGTIVRRSILIRP